MSLGQIINLPFSHGVIDPLVRESSAAPGGIGEVEHPNQSALTVFNTIALTVDSGVAATFGDTTGCWHAGKARAHPSHQRPCCSNKPEDTFSHARSNGSKNVSNCPYILMGYGDIEGVLQALVDSGIFAKPSRLCLMPMLLEEIDNPIYTPWSRFHRFR